MKFNKAEIMKQAWSLLNNETWLCDLEHVLVIGEYRQATFAECLKEAWGIAKEFVARQESEKAYATTSEEKKAWDWACTKLGVTFGISDETKVRLVFDMDKECWPGTSVWSKAMRAVKLHMTVEKQSA